MNINCTEKLSRTKWVLLFLMLASCSAIAADTTTYYYHDTTGSIVAAADTNGVSKWKVAYRPYGKRLYRLAEFVTNTDWFTGHMEDPYSGLIYAGARWYDPRLGRFHGMDPAGLNPGDFHTFNRFSYANNNPYKYVDKNGEYSSLIWGEVGRELIPYKNPENYKDAGLVIGEVLVTTLLVELGGIAINAGVRGAYGVIRSFVAKGIKNLTTSQQRAIRGLQDQISSHQKKLSEYKANPDAFDNKGFLKNAPLVLRAKIIQSRIKSLENQLNTFEKDIDAIQAGTKNVLEKL